ncbi:ABC transporter ATP-binding protein, partial [Caviibacterium pharyngocola]
KVTFYEGNFSDYEEWKKKTFGSDATQPHRMKYKRIAK